MPTKAASSFGHHLGFCVCCVSLTKMKVLLFLGFVVSCIASKYPAWAAVTAYKERSYGEIVDYLLELEAK